MTGQTTKVIHTSTRLWSYDALLLTFRDGPLAGSASSMMWPGAAGVKGEHERLNELLDHFRCR